MHHCPYCLRAKQLLSQRGIPFQEHLVEEEDDAQWDALYQRSGMRTMPQIFFGDELIGGFTELAALDQKNQLKSLSAASK
jgi:glutaredoxin 3